MLVAGISVLFLVMAFGSATGLYQLELLGFNLTGMDAGSTAILFLFGLAGAAFVLSPLILRHWGWRLRAWRWRLRRFKRRHFRRRRRRI